MVMKENGCDLLQDSLYDPGFLHELMRETKKTFRQFRRSKSVTAERIRGLYRSVYPLANAVTVTSISGSINFYPWFSSQYFLSFNCNM
jgi:hypothetical protein